MKRLSKKCIAVILASSIVSSLVFAGCGRKEEVSSPEGNAVNPAPIGKDAKGRPIPPFTTSNSTS